MAGLAGWLNKDTKNDELPQTSPADEDSLQKLCAPQ